MVASKRFQNGVGAHFGFKARFADSIDPTMMAGADYTLNNDVVLMADLTGQKKTYAINLGSDYALNPDVSLRATVTDLANNTPEGTRWGIGLAYTKFL